MKFPFVASLTTHTCVYPFPKTLALEVVVKDKKVEKKRKFGHSLMDVHFGRVILDEAHIIRNRKTRMFKSVVEVQATCRWCLTGTPYVNKAEDIQSLFQFLRAPPLNDVQTWNRAIGVPLKTSGDPIALGKLRVLLSSICMRRTKDLLKDKLPSKRVELNYIKLRKQERETYDVLFDSAKLAFECLLALDSTGRLVMKYYSSILECLVGPRRGLLPKRGISSVLTTRSSSSLWSLVIFLFVPS